MHAFTNSEIFKIKVVIKILDGILFIITNFKIARYPMLINLSDTENPQQQIFFATKIHD